MDILSIALILTFVLLLLLGAGLWVALSLVGVAVFAMTAFTTAPVGPVLATTTWGSTTPFSLIALPLFVWMGEILFRTRLSEDMFRGIAPWVTRLPGRLLHVNVVACGIFAAISGSSAATAVTIGRMSIPELHKRGYDERMSIGTLAGSGTLGFLIPPSIILIVYGVAAELSIARLFIAGILPGVMLIALFMGFIMLWALVNPGRVPQSDERLTIWRKIYESRRLLPTILLIVAVLGSIYLGIATPVEAAVVGVLGSLALAWGTGGLNRRVLADSLMGATRTTCMISFIFVGASFLTIAMGFTGIPRSLAQWIGRDGTGPLRADRRAHRVLHRARLLPRRDLRGPAHHLDHPADDPGRRDRPDVVRHLSGAGGRDVAGDAAGRLQPFRAAGAHRAQHSPDRPRGVPVLPAVCRSGWCCWWCSPRSRPTCRSR